MIAVETNLISKPVRDEIDTWLLKYPPDRKRSALLFALRLVQEQNGGWLSVELMDAVADYLELTKIAVYEVVSFYSMYETKPVGRHKIAVCNSISCMLKGSEKIMEHLEHTLEVKVGETTTDGMFYLKEVECLAACVGAPMLQLDDRAYHENLSCEKIDALLEEIRQTESNHGE